MSTLRVGFFKVETHGHNRISIATVLKRIFDLPLQERVQDISSNASPFIVRLERFSEDDTYVFGEITRVQTEDIPAEAHIEGVADLGLEEGSGLGYFSAFRYHKRLGILVMQLNRNSTSLARLATYLERYIEGCQYRFAPLGREDAWQRFNDKKPRKFSVAIANPQNWQIAEDERHSLLANARRMTELYEGVSINIEVSVGRARGNLDQNQLRSMVESIMGLRQRNPEAVRTLKIYSGTDTRVEEAIDFLEEILVERVEIDLPPEGVERNYALRRDQIKTLFTANMEMLERLYGQNGQQDGQGH